MEDYLLLTTRIFILVFSFALFLINVKALFKPKPTWFWLKILGGIGGFVTFVFYLLITINAIEVTRVMINPVVLLLISILLSNNLYSRKREHE